MGFGQTVEQNLLKNDGFNSNGVLDLREKKIGFQQMVEQNLPQKMMGLIVTVYQI